MELKNKKKIKNALALYIGNGPNRLTPAVGARASGCTGRTEWNPRDKGRRPAESARTRFSRSEPLSNSCRRTHACTCVHTTVVVEPMEFVHTHAFSNSQLNKSTQKLRELCPRLAVFLSLSLSLFAWVNMRLWMWLRVIVYDHVEYI